MKKIIKNALFFTILGIKRNFVALLGIILVVLITPKQGNKREN